MSVTCVSHVDRNYKRGPNANFGRAVTIAAPGVDVRTLRFDAPNGNGAKWKEQTSAPWQGSSLATPLVTYEAQVIGFTALPSRKTALSL